MLADAVLWEELHYLLKTAAVVEVSHYHKVAGSSYVDPHIVAQSLSHLKLSLFELHMNMYVKEMHCDNRRTFNKYTNVCVLLQSLHVEDITTFTELAKIKYFFNKGSWAWRNFCPVKILSYTVLNLHVSIYFTFS